MLPYHHTARMPHNVPKHTPPPDTSQQQHTQPPQHPTAAAAAAASRHPTLQLFITWP
jgi:hypothetical protein